MSAGGDSVQITFAEQHIIDSLKFHCSSIFGFEQNGISYFHTTNVRSGGDHFRPTEATTNLSGCRDDDSPARATLSILAALANQNTIVQELDGH